MGNLVVTPRMMRQEFDAFRQEIRQEMDHRFDAFRQDFQDEMDYRTGEYYSAWEEIWDEARVDFTGSAAVLEKHRKKDKEAMDYYRNPSGDVLYLSDKFKNDNLFPNTSKSMAHLVPRDASCSLAWLRALSMITGIEIDKKVSSPLFDENLRTFVEGRASEVGDGEVDRLDNLPPSEEEQGKTSNNVPLKMWYWNFLNLPNHHYEHFDALSGDKKMIVCPIWDPTDVWKPGTGYKLMIVATPSTYMWLMGKRMPTEAKPQRKWLTEAKVSEGEAHKATNFLALTVQALADLLFDHGESDMGDIAKRQIDQRQKSKKNKKQSFEGSEQEMSEVSTDSQIYTELEKVFKAISGAIQIDHLSWRSDTDISTGGDASGRSSEKPDYKKKAGAFAGKVTDVVNLWGKRWKSKRWGKKVNIPVFKGGNDDHILVADLSVYFEGMEHMIPDPFLVALKAAVSWSSVQEPCQELLPACANHFHRVKEIEGEDQIPEEINTITGEDAGQEDDGSVMSLSEMVTGQPGETDSETTSVVSSSR